jgi:hypothetical protein
MDEHQHRARLSTQVCNRQECAETTLAAETTLHQTRVSLKSTFSLATRDFSA